MQLKLDRKEVEAGFFRKRVEFELRASLQVSPEEEEAIKRHGFWDRSVRPLQPEDEEDFDLEVFAESRFKHLIKDGVVFSGSLEVVQAVEHDLVSGCKLLKLYCEGGQAGGRVIDI